MRLVQQRRSAIEKVAAEIMAAEDERLSGERLVEIIEVWCSGGVISTPELCFSRRGLWLSSLWF